MVGSCFFIAIRYFHMIAWHSSRKWWKTTSKIHHRHNQNQNNKCVLQVHQTHNNPPLTKSSSSTSSQLVKLAAFHVAAHMSQYICAATAATIRTSSLSGNDLTADSVSIHSNLLSSVVKNTFHTATTFFVDSAQTFANAIKDVVYILF